MSASDVHIVRVTAAEVRPLRAEVLRPGVPPASLVYEGDEGPDALHVAARDAEGEIQGIASLCRESAPQRPDVTAWRLRGMATRPPVRGSGVGRRLLYACFRHVRDQHGGLLWCNARVGALGFYERLGLHREGEMFDIAGIGPHFVMSRWLAHLRPGRRDEAAAMSALARRSKAHWGYPPEFLQQCAAALEIPPADIESGGRHHVVAEVQGELAGFHVVVPEAGGVLLLDAMFVEPAWIGGGIGRELFEHARRVAGKLGASRLRIIADPHAEGFYLRMGATPAGEAPGSEPGRTLRRFELEL